MELLSIETSKVDYSITVKYIKKNWIGRRITKEVKSYKVWVYPSEDVYIDWIDVKTGRKLKHKTPEYEWVTLQFAQYCPETHDSIVKVAISEHRKRK